VTYYFVGVHRPEESTDNIGKFDVLGAVMISRGLSHKCRDAAIYTLRLRNNVPIDVFEAIGKEAEENALQLVRNQAARDRAWMKWAADNLPRRN